MPPKYEPEECKRLVEAICLWLGLSTGLQSDRDRLRGALPTTSDERDRIARRISELTVHTRPGMDPIIIQRAIHEKLTGRNLDAYPAEEFGRFRRMVGDGTIKLCDVYAKIYQATWNCDFTEAHRIVENHYGPALGSKPAQSPTPKQKYRQGFAGLSQGPQGPVQNPRRNAGNVNPATTGIHGGAIQTTPYATPGSSAAAKSPPYSPRGLSPTGYPSNQLQPGSTPRTTPASSQSIDPQLSAGEGAIFAGQAPAVQLFSPVAPTAPVATGAWRYLPQAAIPDPQPQEYVSWPLAISNTHLALGSRVRGKKHKHDGRACDDWFEMSHVDGWTILAVADGAGSKEFSRVGAEHACKGAIKFLEGTLREFRMTELPRELGRGADWCFNDANLETMKCLLHGSFESAYGELQVANNSRQETAHRDVLGRSPVVDDFACTLLVGIHTVIKTASGVLDLVMACQVGDGIAAAVSGAGSLALLGEPARGGHAGETAFITDRRRIEPTQLSLRTQVFCGNLRALMLMTDGVADDFFPNDPDLLRLYADLVLNGIIQLADAPRPSPAQEKRENGSEVKRAPFVDEIERLVDNDTHDKKVMIRSAEKYADGLGLSVGEMVKSSQGLIALSAAAALGPAMAQASTGEPLTPEKRLEIWLDSYHVRGSFDDRTLVVLHPVAGALQNPAADGGGAS